MYAHVEKIKVNEETLLVVCCESLLAYSLDAIGTGVESGSVMSSWFRAHALSCSGSIRLMFGCSTFGINNVTTKRHKGKKVACFPGRVANVLFFDMSNVN